MSYQSTHVESPGVARRFMYVGYQLLFIPVTKLIFPLFAAVLC
jgi:hypothetical protein